MYKEEKQVSYGVEVYNNYVSFPIAIDNIEDFDFEELLFHINPNIREFNFIVITKYIENEKGTTIKPMVAIYNKKDWKVKSEYVKSFYGLRIKTWCYNKKRTLDYAGRLIKLPCNKQKEMINIYNIISKKLVRKNNITLKKQIYQK